MKWRSRSTASPNRPRTVINSDIFAAWIAILYLEACYWIVRAVFGWAPMIASAIGAGWFARQSGFEMLEALGVGVVVCFVIRGLRYYHVEPDDTWL